jgi:hypothetical protein
MFISTQELYLHRVIEKVIDKIHQAQNKVVEHYSSIAYSALLSFIVF